MRNTIFESAHSPETLAAALANWINPANNTTMLATSALPEWPVGAPQPANAEFPFYPEANITREAYARLRAENRPLLCYVQGSESMACLALDGLCASSSANLWRMTGRRTWLRRPFEARLS